MTWLKLSDTYPDETGPLSDAAFRAHTEALGYVMRLVTGGRFPVRELRRITATDDYEIAAAELVAKDYWIRDGEDYVIVHAMDWQRSPGQIERDREANAAKQARHRERNRSRNPVTPGTGTGDNHSVTPRSEPPGHEDPTPTPSPPGDLRERMAQARAATGGPS